MGHHEGDLKATPDGICFCSAKLVDAVLIFKNYRPNFQMIENCFVQTA